MYVCMYVGGNPGRKCGGNVYRPRPSLCRRYPASVHVVGVAELAGDGSTSDAHLEVDAAAAALVAVGAARRAADGRAAAGTPTSGIGRRRNQQHHCQRQQPCVTRSRVILENLLHSLNLQLSLSLTDAVVRDTICKVRTCSGKFFLCLRVIVFRP